MVGNFDERPSYFKIQVAHTISTFQYASDARSNNDFDYSFIWNLLSTWLHGFRYYLHIWKNTGTLDLTCVNNELREKPNLKRPATDQRRGPWDFRPLLVMSLINISSFKQVGQRSWISRRVTRRIPLLSKQPSIWLKCHLVPLPAIQNPSHYIATDFSKTINHKSIRSEVWADSWQTFVPSWAPVWPIFSISLEGRVHNLLLLQELTGVRADGCSRRVCTGEDYWREIKPCKAISLSGSESIIQRSSTNVALIVGYIKAS
jgi:hypothetical protein